MAGGAARRRAGDDDRVVSWGAWHRAGARVHAEGGGEALEGAHRIDTVVLDKTGTITLGRPTIGDVVTAVGVDATELLDLAGSAERGSEHPIGKAVVARARLDELGFRNVTEFRALGGHGVEARVDGRRLVEGVSAPGAPAAAGTSLQSMLTPGVLISLAGAAGAPGSFSCPAPPRRRKERILTDRQVALYARVSSEQQAEANTIRVVPQ